MPASPVFPPDRVTVVGVLNATPDSFSDGGRFVRHPESVDVEAAVAAAAALLREGADVIDVGGESTRPGACAVPAAVEAARAVPVIERCLMRPVGCRFFSRFANWPSARLRHR